MVFYCIVHIIKSYQQNTNIKNEINKTYPKNEIGASYVRRGFLMFIGVVQPFIKMAQL